MRTPWRPRTQGRASAGSGLGVGCPGARFGRLAGAGRRPGQSEQRNRLRDGDEGKRERAACRVVAVQQRQHADERALDCERAGGVAAILVVESVGAPGSQPSWQPENRAGFHPRGARLRRVERGPRPDLRGVRRALRGRLDVDAGRRVAEPQRDSKCEFPHDRQRRRLPLGGVAGGRGRRVGGPARRWQRFVCRGGDPGRCQSEPDQRQRRAVPGLQHHPGPSTRGDVRERGLA